MVKNLPANAGDLGLIPGLGRYPRRKWQPTPVFFPGKPKGQRSQRVGCYLVTKQQQTIPEVLSKKRQHFQVVMGSTGCIMSVRAAHL